MCEGPKICITYHLTSFKLKSAAFLHRHTCTHTHTIAPSGHSSCAHAEVMQVVEVRVTHGPKRSNTHSRSVSIWHTHTQKYTDSLSVSHTHTHTYCLHPLALLCCTDLAWPRPTLLFLCVCVYMYVRVCFVLLSKWGRSEGFRHCCFLHVDRTEEVCFTTSPGWIIVCFDKEHTVPEG